MRALAEWLDDTRLTLNSVHAPICASLINGAWGETFSNAIADDARRRKALAEAEAALAVAQIVPYRHLVVHLGVPDVAEAGAVRQQPRRRAPQRRGAPRDGRTRPASSWRSR